MTLESAVFVDDLSTLDDVEDDYEEDFDRLYFGNEFCDKRLPSSADVLAAHEAAEDRGMDFTYVTPILTPTKIDELSSNLDALESIGADAELIFNDWGVYTMADDRDVFDSLVAGRVMSRQKRDPTVTHLTDGGTTLGGTTGGGAMDGGTTHGGTTGGGTMDGGTTDTGAVDDGTVDLKEEGRRVSERVLEHFQKSSVNAPYSRSHLADRGIDRVELDVLTQGVYDEEIQFSASLYHPWNFVTVKRWCRESTTTPLCNEACDETVYSLDNRPVMPQLLYRKNNVVFMYNEEVPDISYVDRDVFVPEPIN